MVYHRRSVGARGTEVQGRFSTEALADILPVANLQMLVRLFVSNDKANVKKVVLRSDTVIGRAADCNLRIASNEVSRRHCTILLVEPNTVRVRDLGSSNGTFVDGRKIEANVDVPIRSGAELEIGNVRFTVNYDAPSGQPANAEQSTAEVPNTVLVAKLAGEEAGVEAAAPADDSSAETVSAMQPPAEVIPAAEETLRDLNAETIHEPAPDAVMTIGQETINMETDTVDERMLASESAVADDPAEGDDDTFALKDSEAPSQQDDEETVTMSVDELPLPTAADEPQPVPEPEKKKIGWKSLFGLLGGKGSQKGQTSQAGEAEPEPVLEEGDETLRMPEESQPVEEPDDVSIEIEETVQMSSDDALRQEVATDEEPADDELQDFFQQFPQE